MIRIYIAIAIIIACLAVGFAFGWNIKGGIEASKQIKAIAKAVEESQKIADKDMELVLEAQEEKIVIQKETEILEKEVIRYVEKRGTDPVCLDDAGRVLWNNGHRNP